ncbi:MAG: hypothetical protein ABSH19_08320 [Opitutales bacterium]|jgi:hypothetical protein
MKWEITVLEHGKPRSIAPQYFDEPVDRLECSNPRCVKGGFKLKKFFADFKKLGQKNNLPAGEKIPCCGKEQLQKGKPPSRKCSNYVLVKVEVK